MHKLKILNLKDLIKLQNILFINDCLEEERGRSFNTTFKLMGTNQFYNTQYLVIHTNWKDMILKQKNMAASLY